jgi:hypothetical protein
MHDTISYRFTLALYALLVRSVIEAFGRVCISHDITSSRHRDAYLYRHVHGFQAQEIDFGGYLGSESGKRVELFGLNGSDFLFWILVTFVECSQQHYQVAHFYARRSSFGWGRGLRQPCCCCSVGYFPWWTFTDSHV